MSELAFIAEVKPAKYSTGDAMTLPSGQDRRSLAASSWVPCNACPPDTLPWGAPGQNPAALC